MKRLDLIARTSNPLFLVAALIVGCSCGDVEPAANDGGTADAANAPDADPNAPDANLNAPDADVGPDADFGPDAMPSACVVAFETNRDGQNEVYTMWADGTHVVNVSQDAAYDGVPQVSPDGSKILFNSTRDHASGELYTMNIDGTNVQRITVNSESELSHQWSEDGAKIAFRVTGNDPRYSLIAANADGTDQATVVSSDFDDSTVREFDWSSSGAIVYVRNDGSASNIARWVAGTSTDILNHSFGRDSWPNWSPDGSKVAYAGQDSDGRGGQHIRVVNANGTSDQAVTTLADESAKDREPRWSPDGQKIAFYRAANPGVTHVYVVDADGTDELDLSPSATVAVAPSWSRDSSQILFTVNYGGSASDILVVKPDGTGASNLTRSPTVLDRLPSWGVCQ